MLDKVLNTPLKFVSNASNIFTHLVALHICLTRHTHPLVIDYPVKHLLDKSKTDNKNFIWVARGKNKPVDCHQYNNSCTLLVRSSPLLHVRSYIVDVF